MFLLTYAHLSQNFVVAIYALFPQIFSDQKVKSADFFTFRMYASICQIVHICALLLGSNEPVNVGKGHYGLGGSPQEHHLLRFFGQSSKVEQPSVSARMQVEADTHRSLTQRPQFNIDFTQWGEDKQM